MLIKTITIKRDYKNKAKFLDETKTTIEELCLNIQKSKLVSKNLCVQFIGDDLTFSVDFGLGTDTYPTQITTTIDFLGSVI